MGQSFRQIIILGVIILSSCCSDKKSYEYIYYQSVSQPRFYHTILRQEYGSKVKQIHYGGVLSRYYSGVLINEYPDTAYGGHSTGGEFSYMRVGGFKKYLYKKDTITQCKCIGINVPFFFPKNVDLPIDEDFNVKLVYQGHDTLFNHILFVKSYNKYECYVMDDTINIYIDLERKLLVKFNIPQKSYKKDSSEGAYEIIWTREVPNDYFDQLWKNSEDETYLDCSIF